MTKLNPENERIKRRYLAFLKEASRLSESSIDQAAAAIDRFDDYNRRRPFKAFHIEQAIGFKKYLAQQLNARTGQALSKATLYSTLTAVKNFFFWLADKPGYRRIGYSDAEYFNLSDKEVRIAKAHREPKAPTLEQIRHVLQTMPAGTVVERRDRALVATAILTGARDGALASLRVKHLDVVQGRLDQDAREVQTKFSKTFASDFFPVGDDIRQIAVDWVDALRREMLWGADDPLFPATRIEVGEQTSHFEAVGLRRAHWSTAAPIRRIFRDAFAGAGLPYFNPHSFRHTLALLGEQRCQTVEEFKAWSQNLGHDGVLTTLTSYGQVARARQSELLRKLAQGNPDEEAGSATLQQIIELASRAQRARLT